MDEATLAEVRALRKQVVELQDQLTSKKVETQKTPCKGTTGRGLPCRTNAVDGTDQKNEEDGRTEGEEDTGGALSRTLSRDVWNM